MVAKGSPGRVHQRVIWRSVTEHYFNYSQNVFEVRILRRRGVEDIFLLYKCCITFKHKFGKCKIHLTSTVGSSKIAPFFFRGNVHLSSRIFNAFFKVLELWAPYNKQGIQDDIMHFEYSDVLLLS